MASQGEENAPETLPFCPENGGLGVFRVKSGNLGLNPPRNVRASVVTSQDRMSVVSSPECEDHLVARFR